MRIRVVNMIVMKLVALGIIFTCMYVRAEKDLIVSMDVTKNKMKCIIHPKLRSQFLTDDFFVEYDPDINLETMSFEILSMPVILNLFSLVWFSGDDYYVDSMDKNLFESFKRLKKLYQFLYPKTGWHGRIIPRKLVDLSPQFEHIHKESPYKAMLFSGGLDSTASFFGHKDEKLHLITACGQPDMPLRDPQGFESMQKYIEDLTHTFGHSNSYIRSNYCEIFRWEVVTWMYPDINNWRLYAVEGMSWAGLTIPILIAKKCSSLYIPGGGSWYYNIITADIPFVNECINFAGFTLVTDQFDKTRFQKTQLIVDIANQESSKKPFIKACPRYSNKSCCKCWKCCSLMMNLLALDEEILDYGFNCTDEQAVGSTIELLNSKLDHFGAWSLKEIQFHARKSIENFPTKKKILEPFLAHDMGGLNIDWWSIKPVDWYDLQKIVPHIEIPADLSEELLSLVPKQETEAI